MSVKKRLFWSHILMFALPMAVYLLVSLLADRISWLWLLQQRFTSMADLEHAMRRAETVSRWVTLGGLTATLVIVNRFLARGVLKKIEGSLKEISAGLRQLQEGNLRVRLTEQGEDEFSALRADFNATAAQLETLVAQENQSEQNRRELLAGISHDLRSPLTAIRAYAEGLLDGVARDEDSRKQYLTIIRDKARDLQGLVNKLFLFSRMDLGENEDHPEPVSLQEEIALLLEVLEPEYADKGLSLTFAAQGEGRVLADPDTLHRIVTNLAENSWKYGAKTLAIALREENAFVSLTFEDDGPGVPQEALPHIFDAFYRADKARNEKISGSGLGLAIVSRAVRNMKGRIIARNGSEQGLWLEIQLPRLEG